MFFGFLFYINIVNFLPGLILYIITHDKTFRVKKAPFFFFFKVNFLQKHYRPENFYFYCYVTSPVTKVSEIYMKWVLKDFWFDQFYHLIKFQ